MVSTIGLCLTPNLWEESSYHVDNLRFKSPGGKISGVLFNGTPFFVGGSINTFFFLMVIVWGVDFRMIRGFWGWCHIP